MSDGNPSIVGPQFVKPEPTGEPIDAEYSMTSKAMITEETTKDVSLSPVTIARVAEALRELSYRFYTSDNGNLLIRFGPYESVWFGTEYIFTVEGSILAAYGFSDLSVATKDVASALIACNEWNATMRSPKAHLNIGDDRAKFGLYTDIFVLSGAHQKLLGDFCDRFVYDSQSFWEKLVANYPELASR